MVSAVVLRDYRSYARLDLELERGLVLVTGPNGAGKTNLLESLHVGTQGFSPRTRADAQLVRFGREAARIALRGRRGGVPLDLEVTLELGSGKRATLNGARLRAAEQLRAEVTTLVFTPDRLVVVKGGPAARRAYFDRVLGRLTPARAGLSAEYGAAVGQRNAALRRVAQGHSTREALAPWNEQVSRLGGELVAGRHETAAALQPRFAERAGELGLGEAELRYEGDAPSVAELEARVERDLERGTTGLGPHLDDVGILAAGRDLRVFGSQGEQRLAVLALLLGEAELLEERRGTRPLLLLDDVLSELDGERRGILAERLRTAGQALVTSASRGALPGEPSQLLEVAQRGDGTSEVRAA
ncbi:MAG TPA: DNA replication and repair protein RecF [Gaiellaceae bacterium]|nr:DNA replication and repair protein RecF [Gaiellaceae bacterium]